MYLFVLFLYVIVSVCMEDDAMKDVFLVNYSVKGIKALDKLSERNQTYFTMPS